jgi:hypothetical protein
MKGSTARAHRRDATAAQAESSHFLFFYFFILVKAPSIEISALRCGVLEAQ